MRTIFFNVNNYRLLITIVKSELKRAGYLMKNRTIFVLMTLLGFVANVKAGLLKDWEFDIDGYKRTYDIFVPDSRAKEQIPLVLLLHGHMGDADVMTGENGKRAPYKVWLSIAKREGWLLVIPDGEFGSDGYRGWNDCRANAKTNPPTDDVKFLNNLIGQIAKQYPVDMNRVYVHGTSNGGNMAYRLAQESGEKYRAVAAVVAAMPEQNKCKPTNYPVSVLIMNGTDDPILPYDGGRVGKRESHKQERGSVLSTMDTVKYWLTYNSIKSSPEEKQLQDRDKKDGSTVVVKRYAGGTNNTEVMLYEVRGGGHTEPSLVEHYGRVYSWIVGKQNKDFEMAEAVWMFFNKFK